MKVCNTIKNRLDMEPVYNEKYFRTKRTSYEGKISTNFHDNKIPNDGLMLLLEQGKTIILKYFWKNVQMLLKKSRCLNILLTMRKFLLMKKILIKKMLMKKTEMKKTEDYLILLLMGINPQIKFFVFKQKYKRIFKCAWPDKNNLIKKV